MSNIKFVSYEAFPEDQYVKELVYLCIDDKYRVAYTRKTSKMGGMFWSVPTVGATKGGVKVYFESFLQDSSFLEKDIKAFLEMRSWESPKSVPARASAPTKTASFDEKFPF